MKKSKLSMRARYFVEGYSFIGLWLVGFLVFMAVPLGRSLYYSFQDLQVSKGGLLATFVGMEHYRAAFTTDVNFLPLLKSTMVSTVTQVPLILIFSLFCAILLNRGLVGKTFFVACSFCRSSLLQGDPGQIDGSGCRKFTDFYNQDLYDKLHNFIPGDILKSLLKYAESLTLVMWDSGVQILIFLAGLQTISVSLYEAAKCDGATAWESFWKITFPMIMPMMLVNTLFSIVSSFTKADNQIMSHILNVVFKNNDFGYGSAMGWIYFVFIFLVLGLVFLLFSKSLGATEGRK